MKKGFAFYEFSFSTMEWDRINYLLQGRLRVNWLSKIWGREVQQWVKQPLTMGGKAVGKTAINYLLHVQCPWEGRQGLNWPSKMGRREIRQWVKQLLEMGGTAVGKRAIWRNWWKVKAVEMGEVKSSGSTAGGTGGLAHAIMTQNYWCLNTNMDKLKIGIKAWKRTHRILNFRLLFSTTFKDVCIIRWTTLSSNCKGTLQTEIQLKIVVWISQWWDPLHKPYYTGACYTRAANLD